MSAKFSEAHVQGLRARWGVVKLSQGYMLAVTGDEGDYAELHLSSEEFYELRESIDDLYWETHPSSRQEPPTD